MKTTVLFSSPHDDGKTMTLLKKFCGDRDVRIINMYEKKIEPCIDCLKCSETGKCFMNSADDILSDIFDSDRVIFASPTYNYTFPPPMISFLSRLQPLYGKDIPIDKKGFLLVTSGTSGKFSLDLMIRQTKIAFAELGIELAGEYLFAFTDTTNTLSPEQIDEIRSLGDKFFDD